jgi:uncharacterized membrane protein YraQ (UPF0718 family)
MSGPRPELSAVSPAAPQRSDTRRVSGSSVRARALRFARRQGLWFVPFIAALALWTWSAASGDFDIGVRTASTLSGFLKEVAIFLPAMFVLVGLFDVWVPRRLVERHVGTTAGPLAIVWMLLLGTLQAGPLYGAFPVAVALYRKGASLRNVFIYLGAFSALKLPMLTFEVGFLGWRFSLVRTLVTVPVFVLLAYVLERLLPPGARLPESTPGETADRSRADASSVTRPGGH